MNDQSVDFRTPPLGSFIVAFNLAIRHRLSELLAADAEREEIDKRSGAGEA